VAITQEDLVVKVGVDSDDAAKEFSSVEKSLQNIEKTLQVVANQLMKQESAFRTVSKSAQGFNQTLETTALAMDTFIAAGIGITALRVAKQFEPMDKAVKAAGASVLRFNSDLVKLATVTSAKVRPGFLGMAEAGFIVAPLLALLGQRASEAENDFLQFSGTLAIVASILIGGFSAAIAFTLAKVGELIAAIGGGLIDAMNRFELEAQKVESATSRMNATIEAFAETVGEEAIGSTEMWNEQLEKLNDTTAFTRDEISKSISLLVSEADVLGLTLAQNNKLLEASASIAEATGDSLLDTSKALVSGLAGNSQAVLALGINIREAAIANTKFVQETGKAVTQLSEQEKVSARLEKIFSRAEKAALSLSLAELTIVDATNILNKRLNELEIQLGQNSIVTQALLRVQTALVDTILQIPKPLLNLIGAFQDFLGVFLLVTGTVLKYVLIIGTLVTAYKLLNVVVIESSRVQTTLNAVFAKASAATGAQVIATNSLSAALINLSRVLRANILTTFLNLGKSLVAFTKGFAVLAVKAAPFIAIAVAIGTALAAVVQAIREVVKELGEIKTQLDETFGEMEDSIGVLDRFKDAWLILKEVGIRAFRFLVESVKIGIFSLLEGFERLSLGITKFSQKIPFVKKSQDEFNATVARSEARIKALEAAASKSGDSLANVFRPISLEALKAEESIKKAEKAAKELADKVKPLGKEIKNALSISVLGTEFEKAILARKNAISELDKVIKDTSSTADQVTQAQINVEKARLDILKLRKDTLSDVANIERQLNLESLSDGEKRIQQIKLSSEERIDLLEKVKSGLMALGNVEQGQINRIDELINKTKILGQQGIDEERAKQIAEENKQLLDQQIALQQIQAENANLIAEFSGSEDDRLNALQKGLDLQNKQLDAKLMEIQLNKQLSAEQKANLGAEIELRKQLNEAQAQRARKQANASALGLDFGQIQQGLGEGAANLASAAGSMLAGPLAAIGAANAVLDAAQGLVNAIPDLLNKLGDLIGSITDLPKAITEGLKNVVDEFIRFVSEFIPNIITGIADKLEVLVEGIFISLPDAIFNLFVSLPDVIIDGLLARLPEIIQKLIVGFVRLTTILPIELAKATPALALGLVEGVIKAIPEIVGAIVSGIKIAINELGSSLGLGKLFDIGGLGDELGEELDKVKEIGSGVGSQLFQVLDLQAEARGISKAEEIGKNISSAFERGKMLLQQIIDGLLNVWRKIVDFFDEKVIQPLVKAWRGVFDFFMNLGVMFDEMIIQPLITNFKGLIDLLQQGFELIFEGLDAVFKPIAKLFMDTFNGIIKLFEDPIGTLKGLFEQGKKAFQDIAKVLTKPFTLIANALGADIDFSDLADAATQAGQKLGDAFIAAIKAPFNTLIDVMNGLKLSKVEPSFSVLGKKVKFTLIPDVDLIPGTIERFQTGGLVPGSGSGDIVPALLEPGEFVLNRSAVQGLGLNTVQNLNRGNQPAGNVTNEFKFGNVIVQDAGDAEKTARKLMPEIKKQLKRATTDGEFIINSRGVR